MVPRTVLHRLTRPEVVHSFNVFNVKQKLRRGEVLFVQRGGTAAGNHNSHRMRSINHLATSLE